MSTRRGSVEENTKAAWTGVDTRRKKNSADVSNLVELQTLDPSPIPQKKKPKLS